MAQFLGKLSTPHLTAYNVGVPYVEKAEVNQYFI